MIRIHRQNKPIKKAPPIPCWASEQAIHRWRQPDNPHMIGKLSDRTYRHTINAIAAALRVPVLPCLNPRAQLEAGALIIKMGGDSPATRTLVIGTLSQISTTQAAPLRQKGERFEKIGFARAILSAQRNQPRGKGLIEIAIGSKIMQLQTPKLRASQGLKN
jgi:hypothetical protein